MLFVAIGLLVLKHAPKTAEAIFARLIPGRSRARQAQLSAQSIDDERAYAEFLVAFKAGPSALQKSKATAPSQPTREVTSEEQKKVPPPATAARQSLIDSMPSRLQSMRNSLQAAQREPVPTARQSLLEDLRVQLHALKEMADVSELLSVWQVSSALAGLVRQLAARPSNVTAHRLGSVANGLDLLASLCQPGVEADLSSTPPIRLLAVDDDLLSRHAVTLSLKQVFNQPDVAANAEAALAQASVIAYDVVFLDVQMPRMDGFELCAKIRETSLNRNTPVVFVTCQSDLEARAKSSLSGGVDLIAKPFLTFELTVKALVLTLRARLEKRPLKEPAIAKGESLSTQTSPGNAALTSASQNAPKVMFADDDVLMHSLYGRHIALAGYQVVSVYDGQEAVESAARELPQVIVMDMVMPVMDGLSALHELRTSTPGKTIPVIAISASADYRLFQQESKLAGVTVFLSKPFGPADLMSAIQSVVPAPAPTSAN
jgi:CheY-like chemotaxis protein